MCKTRPVWIPCDCLHAQCVCFFNEMGAEDPRAILDRVNDTKSALETIIYCDIVFNI
jgi:hypothetical protein